MSAAAWAQLALLLVVLAISIPLLGGYMAKVYGYEKAPGDRLFLPVERGIYRICRVDPEREQRWTVYAFSVLAFSVVGLLLLYAMQRLQTSLPFNPTHAPQVGEALSFNTATSFVTNTNWQSYYPESTLSDFTQMVGLTVQNFVSAAAGMAVMAALIRGLARRRSDTVGNFWVDLTRTTLRILLPIAFVGALVYVGSGVVQNLHGFDVVKTVEGNTQVIPGGPSASQEIIKMLGTNGGGFFNVNSAHPLSNPNGFSDLFGLFLILVIPFALTYTYGKMVGSLRQGYVLLAVMLSIWLIVVGLTTMFELNGNPKLDHLKVDQATTSTQSGGNFEGKEVRFGTPASATWCASTTGTSNGSVNSMHDSYTPLGGMMCLLHMKLGEVSPGGVGVGLNGMLVLALLAVFIAGLMVGRTPEYLGKKIQASEVKLVVLYILAMPVAVLVGAGIAIVTPTV
jgi:K+-transporting ATPase ATPase A chain